MSHTMSRKRSVFNMITAVTFVLMGLHVNSIGLGQESDDIPDHRYTSLVQGRVSPIEEQFSRFEEVNVTDLFLEFSSSVDISAVEVFVEVIFQYEFEFMTIESISFDDSQWLLQFAEIENVDVWIDFLSRKNSQWMEYERLAVNLQHDENVGHITMNNSYGVMDFKPMTNDLLFSIVQIDREVEQRSEQRNTTKKSSRVVDTEEDTSITRRIHQSNLRRTYTRQYQLDNIHEDERSSLEGGSVAAICCSTEDGCKVYSGGYCPGGGPTSCPCNGANQ